MPLFFFFFSRNRSTGLPCWLSSEEFENLPVNTGGVGSIPGSGRSPGERNGNPLQNSCLGNPMDRGARWPPVLGVAKSQIQLSDLTTTRSTIILGKPVAEDDTGFISWTFFFSVFPGINIKKHIHIDWFYFFQFKKKILLCWQITRKRPNCTNWNTILLHQEIIYIMLDFPLSTNLPFGPYSYKHICLVDVTLTCCLPGGQADTFCWSCF